MTSIIPKTWICTVVLSLCVAPWAVYAQEDRTVEVAGHAVRVHMAGWEHAALGQPIVVFEGGSTMPIRVWGPVLSSVAEHTPVVAFDAPGVGGSEWDGEHPTVEHMNRRLHRLLESIEAPPPYILVGHSWAGWLVRGYAGRFPDEVAGLVLVDPTPPQAEFNHMMRVMAASWPPPMQAQQAVIAEYGASRTDPEVPPIPSVPVAVVVAGSYGDAAVPDSLRPAFDLGQFFGVLRRRQISAPIEWVRASPDGTFVLANESGHCIQCDDPQLVAWAIRRVLASVQDEP